MKNFDEIKEVVLAFLNETKDSYIEEFKRLADNLQELTKSVAHLNDLKTIIGEVHRVKKDAANMLENARAEATKIVEDAKHAAAAFAAAPAKNSRPSPAASASAKKAKSSAKPAPKKKSKLF